MKHPAYHLRANKAVDRLTLVDAIRRIAKLSDDLSEYTYYGFGGPYLEDFRLLYEFYPEMKMTSFESNEDTYKRQQFHAPCHSTQLKLKKTEFKTFLARYAPGDEKGIFWLDYTGLEFSHLEEFMTLLSMVAAGSMIKITLRCEPSDFLDKDENEQKRMQEEFRAKFETVLPSASTGPPVQFEQFARLLQDMVQIAAEKALPTSGPLKFLPLSSFCYADGVGMFTLSGIVCIKTEERRVRDVFRSWHLANLNWAKPRKIDVPTLSTKERLHLQKLLPCDANPGRTLRNALGYLIDADRAKTESKLRQYSDFHRYFPYFMKAVP
jgi:Putative O-methyltransferase